MPPSAQQVNIAAPQQRTPPDDHAATANPHPGRPAPLMQPVLFALIVAVAQIPAMMLAWRAAGWGLGLIAAGFALLSAAVTLALAVLDHRLMLERLRSALAACIANPAQPTPPANSQGLLRATDDIRAALRQSRAEADELAELRENVRRVRHDVRGALSPALLTADRLSLSEDATTRRAGENVAKSVERAINLLRALRIRTPEPEPRPHNPGLEDDAPSSATLFDAAPK